MKYSFWTKENATKRGQKFAALHVDGEVVQFRDGYAVRWKRAVCSPRWLSKGAAEAYLDALRKGTREPEYPVPAVKA